MKDEEQLKEEKETAFETRRQMMAKNTGDAEKPSLQRVVRTIIFAHDT